jgi:hypothetical protein
LSCRDSAAVVTGAEFFGLAGNKEEAPDRRRCPRQGLSATGANYGLRQVWVELRGRAAHTTPCTRSDKDCVTR